MACRAVIAQFGGCLFIQTQVLAEQRLFISGEMVILRVSNDFFPQKALVEWGVHAVMGSDLSASLGAVTRLVSGLAAKASGCELAYRPL